MLSYIWYLSINKKPYGGTVLWERGFQNRAKEEVLAATFTLWLLSMHTVAACSFAKAKLHIGFIWSAC